MKRADGLWVIFTEVRNQIDKDSILELTMFYNWIDRIMSELVEEVKDMHIAGYDYIDFVDDWRQMTGDLVICRTGEQLEKLYRGVK